MTEKESDLRELIEEVHLNTCAIFEIVKSLREDINHLQKDRIDNLNEELERFREAVIRSKANSKPC